MSTKITDLITNARMMDVEPNKILDFILKYESDRMKPKEAKAAKPTTRKAYPDEFEKFWMCYPSTSGQSKLKAHESWARLDTADQEDALKALRPYASTLAKPNAPSCAHATTYLNQRRWESFETPTLSLVATQNAVLDDSIKEHRFLAHCRKAGASESDVKYWLGKFTVERLNGKTVCVIDRSMGDFIEAFKETIKRLDCLTWNKTTWENQKEKMG